MGRRHDGTRRLSSRSNARLHGPAFFCLYRSPAPPPPTPYAAPTGTTSGSTRLSPISRLEPSSDSRTLTSATILARLTTHVVPKATPVLSQLRNDRARRERERIEREARERRVSEVAKRKKERIVQLRRKARECVPAEEDPARQRAQKEDEAREREREARRARQWRDEKRREWVAQGGPGRGTGLRIAVRLGNGRRAIERFAPDVTVDRIYKWVECELSAKLDAASDPLDADEVDYVQRFAFRLATTFPRQVVPLPSSLLVQPDGASDALETVADVFAGVGNDATRVGDGL